MRRQRSQLHDKIGQGGSDADESADDRGVGYQPANLGDAAARFHMPLV
jgi:hypothetical protein